MAEKETMDHRKRRHLGGGPIDKDVSLRSMREDSITPNHVLDGLQAILDFQHSQLKSSSAETTAARSVVEDFLCSCITVQL